jgi:hypothetical protein
MAPNNRHHSAFQRLQRVQVRNRSPPNTTLHPGDRVAASAQHPTHRIHALELISHSCGRESVCSAVDVVTGNTLPRAMSALSYQLVTVTNCAAAVALCVATARDGCRSTNLRRPNNGRERNRSFHSRPAQRRSILRWRMLATNVAQPVSRPCDGSTTPLRAGEEQSGAAVSGTPARFTPCRPTRHQPGRQRRVA